MPSKFMRLTKQPDYRLSKRIRAVPRSRRFLNVLNSLRASAGSPNRLRHMCPPNNAAFGRPVGRSSNEDPVSASLSWENGLRACP
jgi:hypothetical protein